MNSKTIVTFLVFLLLVAVGAGFAWFASQLRAVSAEEAAVEFTVQEGEGVRAIASNLRNQGLIRNVLVFSTYAKVEGIAGNFQAGVYNLQPSFSSQEIARILSEGEVAGQEVNITILEGWSNQEIATYLAEQQRKEDGAGQTRRADEFLAALNVTDSRTTVPGKSYTFLSEKPDIATLEGFLFPDTYRIFTTFSQEEIVGKMLDTFGAKIEPLTDDIAASNRTLFEILTIASIIEREVLSSADMKNAADVFWKRLDEGIPLQSDATVNYVTGKNATRPTLEDISVDSPYNTYKYAGLPPGPIGNPSIAAIDAALNPTPNEYYYFLTKEDGTAVFSRTLDEHNANKAKYLN